MRKQFTARTGSWATLTALLLSWLLSVPAAAGPPEEGGAVALRRFALVVGANDGGDGRVRLLYAHTDARAIADVLQELGGVGRRDLTLLTDPTRKELEEGFANIRAKLRGAKWQGVRVEVLFYYSGHSDETGLLLGSERFSYKEIRSQLDGILPADVRIGILDSCASGALTRSKGGKWRAPFLVDESSQVSGHAFLTSSSAEEAAQESDKVGGSFFTHYMVSGLRGAADVSNDNRVTLNEAYQYAFNETLARTESTAAGPQHPNYDFKLTGAGDLVLTDLSRVGSLLVLPEDMAGRLFIRDREGRLVAEINKPAGRAVSFGLESGTYSVTFEKKPELYQGKIELKRGKHVVLSVAGLQSVDTEPTVARGGTDRPAKAEIEPEPEPRIPGAVLHVPFNIGLVPGLSVNAFKKGPVSNNFSFNLLVGKGEYLKGMELGMVGSIRTEDSVGVSWSGVFNASSKRFAGWQSSFFVNYGKGELVGLQTAGLLNYAREVKGVQFGLVNVARKMKGAPIGLVNFVGDGRLVMDLWYSDTSVFNVGIKMGSDWFYTLLGFSVQPEGANIHVQEGSEFYTFMAGFGGHIRLGRLFWMDIDAVAHKLFEDYEMGSPLLDMVGKLRLMFGFRPVSALSIFAGPTINLVASERRKGLGMNYAIWMTAQDELHYMLNVGFLVGLQLSPNIKELNSK